MRSVSQQRPSERTRGKSSRSPARGIARSPAPTPKRSASKAKGGFWSEAGAAVLSVFSVRRPMVALTAGVVILTAGAAIVTGGVIDRTVKKTDAAAATLASTAGFAVTEVHLAGNARTKSDDIMAALNLKKGQSIFGVNLQDARARMLSLPWVEDAEIRRHYPHGISVRIVERVPFARWQSPVGLVVVEKIGQVITGDDIGKFIALPLLLGPGAPEHAQDFVAAVARHRGLIRRVKAYEFQSKRRWNLILDGGVVVKLPETGWDKQLKELDRLIVEEGILEHDIREIDLRQPSFLIVKRRDSGEQRERREETGSSI